MINILITGSAGFIGFNLQKYLSKYYRVVGCDNLSSVSKKTQKLRLNQIKKSKLKFIKIDLIKSQNLKKKLKGYRFDLIIHLAATPGVRVSQTFPQSTISNNLISFINVFEYAVQNNINKVFYASSSSVYGNNKSFIEKNTKLDPTSIYGVSKVANEYLARTYNKLYDISSVGLRFFTVYGSWGRPDMAYFKFTKKILNGKKIDIYNKGKMYRDYTYIDDIVDGIFKLINKVPKLTSKKKIKNDSLSPVAPFRILNIGNTKKIYLLDFINTLEKELGKKIKKNYLPMQKGDVYSTLSDTSLLKKITNYNPKTNYKTGVKKFLNWYLNYYN